MIQSMTGFGGKESEIAAFGKISVELRSSNHKFLETVFHLPDGFLALEDRIKKEIEAKIKRGRLVCAINIMGAKTSNVFVNRPLLKRYISTLKQIRRQFQIKDEISINTLIHLPGVLSLAEDRNLKANIWPALKILVRRSLEDLVKTRQKEGRALCGFLKNSSEVLKTNLGNIRIRFKKAVKERLNQMTTDEERSNFLKETDITEEIERLAFHIRNFKNKLAKSSPIGKELDFIAQEMQREANTLAAKSFDVAISARVVKIKSQIERIREQVQNIE
jgi:uncharacterized protein (TIGR00255 family)